MRQRGSSSNQNNQQHVQLPCSQKLISMLPEVVKEDYVGEIMGQNVANRLIIFCMRIRMCTRVCVSVGVCTIAQMQFWEKVCGYSGREATCF